MADGVPPAPPTPSLVVPPEQLPVPPIQLLVPPAQPIPTQPFQPDHVPQ